VRSCCWAFTTAARAQAMTEGESFMIGLLGGCEDLCDG
jgi:hypothetical protein